MPFLTSSNTIIRFTKKRLKWRRYSTAEILPILQKFEFINKRKFAAATLDKNAKMFMIHVTALSAPAIQVDPFCQAQLGLLLADKAFTKVPPEYSDYVDAFVFDHAMELLKNTGMNKYVIEYIEDKQPPYVSIYSLGPV